MHTPWLAAVAALLLLLELAGALPVLPRMTTDVYQLSPEAQKEAERAVWLNYFRMQQEESDRQRARAHEEAERTALRRGERASNRYGEWT